MKPLFLTLLPAMALAGIWPENFGTLQRKSVAPVNVTEAALWQEYGLQQAERAEYEAGSDKLTATAYRFQDSTGSLAAFQWQRLADSKPSSLAKLAVETADAVMMVRGNYMLLFKGHRPMPAEIEPVVGMIPKYESSPLPALTEHLPAENRVPGSERYILGPVGLEKFDHDIPPSTAGFHMGAEAQLAKYRTPTGELVMAVFSYPTPQIARDRLVDFQRISGAMAKRAGPYLAAILNPPNPDAAERLLALVRYEPTLTMSEYVPTRRDNIGHLVTTAFELIGILLVFFLVAGLAFGGLRTMLRRSGPNGEPDSVITLHLRDQ